MSWNLRGWAPALLWTTILFALSSRPTLPLELHSGLDKLAHFGAYAVLGVLLAYGQVRSASSVLLPLTLGPLIGGLEEIFQSTVPGRAAELGDWVADSLGAVFGVAVYHLWWRSRTGRRASAGAAGALPHE